MNALIETLNRWGEAAIPLAGQMLWQTSLLIIVLLALDLLLRHRIRAGFRYALWMLLLVKVVLPPSLALPTGAGYWIERPVNAEAPVEPPVAEVAVLPPPAAEVNHAPDPGIIVEADFFDHLLAEAMAAAPPAATAFEVPTAPAPAATTPTVQLTRPGQLLAVWLAGTWLLLGWMLWRWRWVNRLVRASEPAPAELQMLLTNVYRHNVCRASCRHSGRDRHSVRSGEADEGAAALETNETLTAAAAPDGALGETRPTIPLRLTDAAMSPAVCGLFRPVILLPRKLVGKLSREQLGTVLLHELIHLRRRDLWVNCAQTLLQIAAWWHPLLWLANARIRRVREEAVDEAVACALRDDADAYPATLLEVAKLTFTRPLMTLGLVGILESKHALKQRIRRLLELPPLESTRFKWWQWLAVAVIALTALPMAEGQRPADVVSSDPSTVDSGDQVQEQVAAADASARKNVEEHGAAVERAYDVLLERLNRLGSDIPALTNALHEAQMELEKWQAERSAVLVQMLVNDVWLLDKNILEHPFVKRHMEALNLAPPPEWVAIDERYQTARKVRDMITMKLAQEKINEALRHDQARVDQAEVRAEFQRQLDSAERGLELAREEYRALQEKLGPDPLTRPEQTLSKEEFLRLMPVIQASIRLNQSSNSVQSARDRLAEVEARAKDQGSLSPQSGVGNPAAGAPRQFAAVNPARLPITMQVRAVKLSRRAWQELTNRVGTQPVSGQAQAFIHPEAGLDDWLAGHAEVETIESGRITAPERRTSILGAGTTDGATDAASRARIELTTWRDTQGANQVWLQLKAAINWSGPVTQDGGPAPAATGADAAATESAGVTFGTNTRGYVNQQLATAGVKLTAGQWAIIGGPAEGQTAGPVFAVVASPLLAQGAGVSQPEHPDRLVQAAKIQNAKELIETGKLDEAEVLLRQAATSSTAPTEVYYYLDRIQQLKLTANPLPNPYAQRPPMVHDSPGRHKIMEKLNRIILDQVRFDKVPLLEVVKELQEESRRRDPEKEGIRFMINSSTDSGATAAAFHTDPVTGAPIEIAPSSVEALDVGGTIIEINPPFSILRLIDVLNTIVMSADRPIKFTVEEFAVVFAPRTPEPEHLETRVFRVHPNISDRMKAAQTNAPIPSGAVTNEMSVVNQVVRHHFKAAGVSLVAPKMLYFNERTGMLMIKATLEDLEIIQRALEKLRLEGEPQTSPPAESGSGAGATDGKPDEATSKVENAKLLMDAGKLDEAEALLREAAVNSTTPTEVYYHLDRIQQMRSAGTQRPESLETRVFRVNPNTFYEGLKVVMTNALPTTPARTNAPAPAPTVQASGGGGIRFLTTNDMSVVNVAVRDYFEMVGVKFEPPKMIFYNDRTGMLMVKATLADLEIVQRAVEMLNYEPPQVTLEVRTVEVTKDDVRALGFDWFMSPVPSQSASPANTITGILTDPQFRVVMKALEQRTNVNVNLFPRTTTLSWHPTQIKSTITMSNIVVAVTNTPAGQSYITDDVEVGTKLDLAPQVGADGYTIRLGVVFERTDFLGYSDPVEAGKPAGTPLPRFKLFSMATTANVWDGQTLVIGGTLPEPDLQAPDAERRQFMIFITPTIIDPAGNRVHSPEQLPFTREQVPSQPGQD